MNNLFAVINTIHRPVDLVSRALRSALNQSPAFQGIYLIDQNPVPLDLPQELMSEERLVHLHAEVPSVSKARNQALNLKWEGWLVFCDDDGYLAADYTEKLIQEINRNPGTSIFAGTILRDDTGAFYSHRHQVGGNLNHFMSTKLLMGSNFCVKTETFFRLKGFDERFGAGAGWGSGEETDFAWKAYFSGVPMKFSTDLRVFHPKPYSATFSANCKKAFNYGRGKGALVGKWLIEERQPKVLFELSEMLALPTARVFVKVISFQLKEAAYLICSIAGRIKGVFEFWVRGLRSSCTTKPNG